MDILDVPLKKAKALKLFNHLDSETKREDALAKMLGIHRTSVHRWTEYVPRPYAIIVMNLAFRSQFGLKEFGG